MNSTAVTGELFGAARHSVLVRADARDEEGAAFAEGLKRFSDFPTVPVLHRLFECRSRVLSGEMPASHAAAFLSGLLIAGDVAGALTMFADCIPERTVRVIGAPQLTQRYAAALKVQGYGAAQVDGAAASLSGLTCVHHHLASQVHARAG